MTDNRVVEYTAQPTRIRRRTVTPPRSTLTDSATPTPAPDTSTLATETPGNNLGAVGILPTEPCQKCGRPVVLLPTECRHIDDPAGKLPWCWPAAVYPHPRARECAVEESALEPGTAVKFRGDRASTVIVGRFVAEGRRKYWLEESLAAYTSEQLKVVQRRRG